VKTINILYAIFIRTHNFDLWKPTVTISDHSRFFFRTISTYGLHGGKNDSASVVLRREGQHRQTRGLLDGGWKSAEALGWEWYVACHAMIAFTPGALLMCFPVLLI